MAATNPPLLPISTQTPASQAPSTTDPAAPGVRFFLLRFSDSVQRSLSDRRPWSELIDRTAFARPESFSDATSRLRKNLGYFRVNYAAIIAVCLAALLLTHPISLAVLLALLAAWCFMYLLRPSDPPLVLFGRTFSDRETLLGLVVVTFLVVFLTSVGSLIISALLIGSGLVCLHGAFHVPEDLFLDEVDSVTGGAAGGLLSFLGGAGSTGRI
jgi:PRA1 family protein 1